MPLELLLAWWNLIYILPFGLALFYLGLFVFTGITFGEADADADMDADAQLHVEAHVAEMESDAGMHMEHDAGTEHEMGTDPEAQGDATQGGGLLHPHGSVGAAIMAHTPGTGASTDADAVHASHMQGILSLLGLGKIPLSLALMVLMMCWGIVGFALNALLFKGMGASILVPAISLPITLLLSLTLTGLCAALIGKIIPTDDGTRERRQDLVGKCGDAIYDIDGTFGMATVRGSAGDFYQIPCRTAVGKPRIAKGTRVVIFDYDREKGVFHVAPFDA
jgi:membrane protein implicated in regulation of membrane protease activity